MGLFNTNWRTQVTNLLPVFKRSTSLIDFIYSLVKPLQTASDDTWNDFDIEIRKMAKFNSQTIVLRSALNNVFGVTSPPYIYIETLDHLAKTSYVYNESENFNPVFVYNDSQGILTHVFNDSEIDNNLSDFVVHIPVGIHTPELEIQVRNQVKIYHLAGMSFTIDTY